MKLGQEKKSNTLKFVILCVLAGFLLAMGAAVRTVYGSTFSVVYEHDKLYKKFKENYELKGETPQLTEKGDPRILVENENFTVKYSYTKEKMFSLSIINNKTGEAYSSRSEIYGVNADGETVFTYSVCSGEAYYDPYSEKFDHGIRFTEVTEDKVVIEVLLLQSFFIERSYFKHARFMTVEDFEKLTEESTEEFKEKRENFWNNLYTLTSSDEMSFMDRESLFGEDSSGIPGVDMNKFSEPFYYGRNLSVRVDTILEEANYTIENKRLHESKFIKKGYEAPMALARFTIDISGEELKYEAELVKAISPQKSSVVDIIVPEDRNIAYENWEAVEEGIKSLRSQNYKNVVNNITTDYSEYPVNYELTLGKNKVDCELLLNNDFGFGDSEIKIYKIYESDDFSKPFYEGNITEGEPLHLELSEAKYTETAYVILIYNPQYIYEFKLGVKLSGGDSLSHSRKNLFYNEIGEISFEAYKNFSIEQLEDFSESLNNYDWDKHSDYDYNETVCLEKIQNLYEGSDSLVLKYFRSDSTEARYLIEVRSRAYKNRRSEEDPCILSAEVIGDAILGPFFMEEDTKYYLKITRLDDGEPTPYALYGYRLH